MLEQLSLDFHFLGQENDESAVKKNQTQNQNQNENRNYKIRKSKRAKRIYLRILPGKGLEIVVPERARRYSIEDLLETHKSWIEKTLEKYKIDPNKQSFMEENEQTINLPTEFCFAAIQKKIKIAYQKESRNHLKCQIIRHSNSNNTNNTNNANNTNIAIEEYDQTYQIEHWIIKGETDNKKRCQKLINKMIKKEASRYLIPWLQKVSLTSSLPFNSVQIRLQSSLWGSCTRDHNISLNAKLLFAEPRLVQYVLVHELCHTKHLNHSKRFWNLVFKFDPDFLLHRKLLKEASKSIM